LFFFGHVGKRLAMKRRNGPGSETENGNEGKDSHGFWYYRPLSTRSSGLSGY
jgi:hypothetical protein